VANPGSSIERSESGEKHFSSTPALGFYAGADDRKMTQNRACGRRRIGGARSKARGQALENAGKASAGVSDSPKQVRALSAKPGA